MPNPERTTPLCATLGARLGAGFFALMTLGVLTTAAWLSPSNAGHGTHTQLGLDACAWAVWFDKPCPSCGMTTSFAHAGEGHWAKSATTQPFALLLVIGSAAVFWGSLVQAATGAKVGHAFMGMLRPRVFLAFGALAAGAWIYKIVTW